MKILAIGDIHNGPNFDRLEEAIKRERPDSTIFLGDYFDQWNDRPGDVVQTAEWLRVSIRKSDRIHLWGNHDLPYASLGTCPGWTHEKHKAVNSVLKPADWDRLRLWHFHQQSWLFTHAGLSAKVLPVKVSTKRLEHWLRNQEKVAWRRLHRGEKHWIWSVGVSRGGDSTDGGILWCDLGEFAPIPGVNQVFGHTVVSQPIRIKRAPSENWCIDVSTPRGVTHALLIEGTAAQVVAI